MTNWFITGDTHGHNYERVNKLAESGAHNFALIVLGDAGFNFFLDSNDEWRKSITNKRLENLDSYIYCVRGNHEARPQNLDFEITYDGKVAGYVYWEPRFERLRYFMDGNTYIIDGKSTLVIGSAYSVDKYWRLKGRPENTTEWTGWFKDEQLTEAEKSEITMNTKNASYDLVLTHTCPISLEPKDLFLSSVDQSTVDKSTELWLEEIKEQIDYGIWVWGHFHANRWMRPNAFMLYEDVLTLDEVFQMEKDCRKGEMTFGRLPKSPDFYMI